MIGLRRYYVIQALDDGTFFTVDSGCPSFVINLRDAMRFTEFEMALDYAREISTDLDPSRVAIHEIFAIAK